MIVVSNSSPLIGLSAIGQLELLKYFYQTIYIPESVYDEVTGSTNRIGASEVKNALWFEKRRISLPEINASSEKFGLGKGETAALLPASKLNADLLIIDDLKARKTAQNQKQPIIGILGIFLLAKSQNLIPEVRKPLDDLIAFGYWISPNLYRKILQSAKE